MNIDLTEAQINEALTFYTVNKGQIDVAIAAEQSLEVANGWAQAPSGC